MLQAAFLLPNIAKKGNKGRRPAQKAFCTTFPDNRQDRFIFCPSFFFILGMLILRRAIYAEQIPIVYYWILYVFYLYLMGTAVNQILVQVIVSSSSSSSSSVEKVFLFSALQTLAIHRLVDFNLHRALSSKKSISIRIVA